ncbi:hypothetical protein HMPREF0591_0278 [Mycobacterium parascrofulaceum ATCC BAA-614]|uniref:Uncharacterized protein n=1 Tax=Mycobacterium parascrofulaceum ATCC BAA-614 TaxID=525368 RepID=D5P284_9MYCO|nr:hypothetical protein HMPREF0591_0278 [Mycobacterium parascrofulaceum ATCC BAA-614]
MRTYATNAPDGYPPTAQIRSKPCLVHGKFLCAGRQHRDAIAKALSPIYTATTHFYQFSRTSRRYHPPQTLGYLLRAAQRVEGQTQLRRRAMLDGATRSSTFRPPDPTATSTSCICPATGADAWLTL